MTAIAKRKQDDEHLEHSLGQKKVFNPLDFIPEKLKQPLSAFWMRFKNIMPSILGISALLATWHRQGGITEQQIMDILEDLSTPERVANFKWASDIQIALAREVSERIRRNRVERDMLARRRGLENGKPPAEFSFAESFKKLLSESSIGVGEPDKSK